MGDKLDDFKPQEKNANKHTEYGLTLLERSIQENGWLGAITATNDGEVFAGSARLEKLAELMPDVEPIVIKTDGNTPVIVQRTDIESAKDPRAIRAGLADNRVQEVDLDFDTDVLADLYAQDKGLLDGLWNDQELIDMDIVEEIHKDAPPETNRAEELLELWGVKLGDLWRVGEHRLICGDCTDADTVARLMGGERADMVFTDPPYSFETDGGLFNGKRPKVMDRIKENKTNIFDPHPFLNVSIGVFEKNYFSMFVFCNKALLHHYLNFAIDNKYSYNLLVWKKTNVVPFGDSHFPDVEYIVFIRKNAKWNNGTNANRSKVLEYPQDFESQKGHPTPKPEELVRNQLVLTTNNNDVVVDFFLGSGTTMLASENLSRRCYALEISPAYVAVSLERMATAFPELVIERIE